MQREIEELKQSVIMVTNATDVTEEGYAIDARQNNAAFDGGLRNLINKKKVIFISRVVGAQNIEIKKYNGMPFIAIIHIESNPYLGLSITGIVGTDAILRARAIFESENIPYSASITFDANGVRILDAFRDKSNATNSTSIAFYVLNF